MRITELSRQLFSCGEHFYPCVHNGVFIAVYHKTDSVPYEYYIVALAISESEGLVELDRIFIITSPDGAVYGVSSDGDYIYIRAAVWGNSPNSEVISVYTFSNGAFSAEISNVHFPNQLASFPPFVTAANGYIFTDLYSEGQYIQAYTFNGSSFSSAGTPFQLDSNEGLNSAENRWRPIFSSGHLLVYTESYTAGRRLSALSFNGSSFSRDYSVSIAEGDQIILCLSSRIVSALAASLNVVAISDYDGNSIVEAHEYDPISETAEVYRAYGDAVYIVAAGNGELWIADAAAPFTVYGAFAINFSGINGIFIHESIIIASCIDNNNVRYLAAFYINNAPDAPLPPESDIVEVKAVPVSTIAVALNSDRAFILGVKPVNQSGDSYIQVTDYQCRTDFIDVQRNVLTAEG